MSFFLIAEISCVHLGSLKRAKKLAKLAKDNGADILKTQKRNPKECVPKKLWNAPHPNEAFSYGKTYLEHRENLELSIEEHRELKKYCEEIGIEYSTSVWDITSAKQIIELNPKRIKIPSACNHNKKLIDLLLNDYKGEVHISLGMTNKEERENFYREMKKYDERLVVYSCTSGYPVYFDKIYLREIETLSKIFTKTGFSNHGYGIALETAAFSLGARYFERHIIDDRTIPHSDSSASLEPQGLNKLKRNLKAMEEAFKYKPDYIDEIEKEQKNKLRI